VPVRAGLGFDSRFLIVKRRKMTNSVIKRFYRIVFGQIFLIFVFLMIHYPQELFYV